jgi:hypothetical protein
MNITIPLRVTHSFLLSSNLSEDLNATEYNAGTTYDALDEVYKDEVGEHKVYRSVQGSNTGNNPSNDDGTWWVEIGWTNKWKCIKDNTAEATIAEDSSGIFYEIEALRNCSEIGFRGVRASSLNVVVKNGSSVAVYNKTKTMEESYNGKTWYIGDALFTNVPFADDYTVEITAADPSNSDLAQIGQIVMGYTTRMGRMIGQPLLSADDQSRKEQDADGNFTVTDRGQSATAFFDFRIDTSDAWIVEQLMIAGRTDPRLYWEEDENGEARVDEGLFIFGYMEDLTIVPTPNHTTCSLEVKGLAFDIAGTLAE